MSNFMTNTIQYSIGDATNLSTKGNKIIVHICNDVGGWGKGFVMAISKRWEEPEKKYREWFKSKLNFELGEVQFVKVEEELWVANMIAQRDVKKGNDGNPPIRYEAVLSGLEKVGKFALEMNASVHMPRIGCGLAGGTWESIEPLIQACLTQKGISVTIYDFQ